MDARKVVVTLVCATADAEALDDVVDGLSASGREVGLVSGVDEQPRRVGDAIERCGDLGLVVICTSPRLDGATLRKIEGLFSARKGPNHAMVRIDVGQTPSESVAAVHRAVEAFISSQGRIVRRPTGDVDTRREVVEGISSLALPVVRLPAGEDIEGDTRRIQLPDNAKAVELSRRRRAARDRQRERERITGVHTALGAEVEARAPLAAAHGHAEFDRTTIVLIVGAAVLALLAGLIFAGVLG